MSSRRPSSVNRCFYFLFFQSVLLPFRPLFDKDKEIKIEFFRIEGAAAIPDAAVSVALLLLLASCNGDIARFISDSVGSLFAALRVRLAVRLRNASFLANLGSPRWSPVVPEPAVTHPAPPAPPAPPALPGSGSHLWVPRSDCCASTKWGTQPVHQECDNSAQSRLSHISTRAVALKRLRGALM